MKTDVKRRFLILFAALAIAAASLPVFSAEEAGSSAGPVVITPADCMMNTDGCVVIDNFNRPTVSWTSTGARALDSFDESPFAPFEGSRSLSLTGEASKSLSGEIDSCRYVAFTVWSDVGGSVSLSVSSPYFEFASAADIPGGYWSTVVFDLTDGDSITKNTSPKKGNAKYQTLTVGTGSVRMVLDFVIAFSDGDLVESLRSVCPDWHAEGGTCADGGIFYTGNGGELVGTPHATAADGRGIEIFLENHSNAENVTLTSVFADGSSRKETVGLLKGTDTQSVIFDYSARDVASLRISFDNTDGGYIVFSGFHTVSWIKTGGGSPYRGSIRSCLISRDGRTLTVSGEISGCDGCDANLYSFSRDEAVDTSKRTSLSKATVNDGEFYFSAEVSSDGSAVHRKYAVIITAPEGNVQVGYPFYVTNPGILSGTAPDFEQRSPKGLGVLSDDYLEYDIGCTYVEVNVGELLSAGGGISYSRGGAVCVIDSEAVSGLDQVMDGLFRRGVAVYIRLFAGKTGDLTIDSMTFSSDGSPDVDTFRAVCGFLAERYGTEGGVTENLCGLVVGKAANIGLSGADAGETAAAYAVLFRAVFNTVQAVNREIRVYVPVSGEWFSPSVSYGSDSIRAYAFLRMLKTYLSRGGNVSLSVAADVWDTDTDIPSVIGAVRLIGNDCSLLILGGHEPADENESIVMTSIFAEAVFLGTSGTDVGIDGVIPFFSPDYGGTLMYSDTVSAGKLTYLNEISDYLSELSRSSSKSSGISVSENEIIRIVPSGIEGRAKIYDFSDGASGFTATEKGALITSGVSLGTESGIMSVKFNGVPTWSGVTKKINPGIDLSLAEYISVRATVGTLPNGEDGVGALIILRSGENRAIFRGTVSDNGINELVADISNLDWRGNITEIGVYIKDDGADHPTLLIASIDALSLTASEKEIINRVVIAKEKPEYPLYGLLILCGGAAACIILLTVRAARRRRGEREIY
ncbi:MAG: hypothetical protein IKX86_06880 [Clostridia bacterium]|nr:hypothetical protein [Clostridia bacterium]